jgi:hypothetical protein
MELANQTGDRAQAESGVTMPLRALREDPGQVSDSARDGCIATLQPFGVAEGRDPGGRFGQVPSHALVSPRQARLKMAPRKQGGLIISIQTPTPSSFAERV